jgi:hypothetical protein
VAPLPEDVGVVVVRESVVVGIIIIITTMSSALQVRSSPENES